MTARLVDLVAAELAVPVSPEVRDFAAVLAKAARRAPVAVLFYGSALRTGDLDGILDFYAVVDDPADWSQGRAAAHANRLLPPNVEYHEFTPDPGDTLRAKVAILSLEQFRRLVRPTSLDTTVWARFSQPAALAFARDAAARAAMAEAVAGAVATAVGWGIALSPAAAAPEDVWRALFRRTYASELRVETAGRSDEIVARAPERYRAMFLAARAAGAAAASGTDATGRERSAKSAEHAWRRRARLAKPLNVARLAKAAFTFKGGADYVVWKIRRHTGEEIALTARQRRWPLLLAVPLLRRLIRRRSASGGRPAPPRSPR